MNKTKLLQFVFSLLLFSLAVATVHAEDPAPPTGPTSDAYGIPFVGCAINVRGTSTTLSYCDPQLVRYYHKVIPGENGNVKYEERCAGETDPPARNFQEQYEDFKKDPAHVHLWVEDPQITAQGKADERARQFLYWVLSHPSIDDHPTIKNIWNFSRGIALFLTLFVASIFGLGIIIAQRQNFDLKVEVSPLIIKLVLMLLYITFSASIILTIIQVSEIMMKFFIENLGGKDLFNIYFSTNSGEKNYIGFVGCRDLNIRVQEGVQAELFMLKATNVTYYVMGVMILLRKILLWFLLFVSPFLALLMPFVFIRNIGWIWIGVFFQWVFYGPLFALFLGALAQIWKKGIPFPFNFSRVNTFEGYVFPSAINIAYGGPGQEWSNIKPPQTNNGNYVDTFAEYVITLIMLWAVTFFPWWLLRIFRDYCCDGILAMKNILLQMYDQMRNPPSAPGTGPIPTPSLSFTGTAMKIPVDIEKNIKTKFTTLEEVRQVRTEEISKTLSLSASKITDIARFETNKTTNETVKKNIEYLQNPMKADTSTDRQKFMNIRTELFNRAVKEDRIARQILTATSTSKVEQMQKRQELVKSLPDMRPVTHLISIKAQVPQEKVQSITTSFVQSASQNTSFLNKISQTTQLPAQQVQTILTTYTQNISQPINQVVNNISKQTNVAKDKVTEVLKQTNTFLKNSNTIQRTAVKEKVEAQQIEKIIEALPATIESTQPITTTIALKLHIAEDKAATIAQTLMNSVVRNTNIIHTIQNQTKLDTNQIKNILSIYSQNVNQAPSVVTTQIQQQTGVNKEQVKTVINAVSQNLTTVKDVVKDVAQKENIKEEEVQKVMQAQIPLVAEPEKNIEQTVSVPATVSLEDYEEVKKMWQEQYEKGEVPVSENIQSRQEWVDKDIVLITNTLNKILSADENVRNEGLDDVGYLLPIFMVNNLSGEELIVYLKAKLEAAKNVLKDLTKKEEVEEEEPEEVFVEATQKKEEAKEMELEQAQEIPEEKEEKQEAEKKEPVSEEKPLETPGQPQAEAPSAESEEKGVK